MSDHKPPFVPPARLVLPSRRAPLVWPARQLAALGQLGLYIYLPLSAALLALVFISQQVGIPFESLTRDPAATFDAPFYTGLLSQIGVLTWSAATTICLFSWVVLRRCVVQPDRGSFWLASGLVSGMLLVDDLFLVHESVAWHLLGLSEAAVFSMYGLVLVTYLWWHRQTIWRSDYLLLALSFMLFGASLAIDQQYLPLTDPVVVEDSLKLFGIVTWCWYFAALAARDMGATQKL